ncbi:MAG: Crp/Fnr family transcriptional regulator [Pseudomonadota bacterium]
MLKAPKAIAEIDFPHTGNFLSGRLRKHLNDDDLHYIEDLVEGTLPIASRDTLVERGKRIDCSGILISGFMARTVETGDARCIVGIHVPGDFVDLHGFALKRLDHSVVAVDDVRVGLVQHSTLKRVMEERPVIAQAMWFATLLDAAIHRKWIQMLERLDAPRRIAHIYCELQTRLELIGSASPRVLRAPFTQQDIADMCGVSSIHANRAVSKLREMELAEIRRGTLYTNDWSALRDYARFDPSYLYGDGPLRLNESWR